ncbi:MAG: Na+/H+ antiporter subunit E [Acidimicrobiia bacterium]
MKVLFNIIVLTGLWIALWGDLSAGNVLGGVLVAMVVLAIAPIGRATAPLSARPIAVTRLGLRFLWDLVVASIEVSAVVIRPRTVVESTIVAVPLSTASETIATIVANMVSLTPGTLTLDARHDPPTLYIHVLDARHRDRVIADVQALENRVSRALGVARPSGPIAHLGHEESAP